MTYIGNVMKKFKVVFLSASIVLITLLVIFSGIQLLQKESTPERMKVINKMKQGQLSFSFQDTNGHTYQLNSFQEKVVLVNLWATWCIPCVDELPSLIRLAKKFPKKLVIIALTEDTKQKVDHFFNRFDYKLPKNFIISVRFNMREVFSPQGLPESYLFDPSGKLISKVIGPRHWDQLEWVSQIQKL